MSSIKPRSAKVSDNDTHIVELHFNSAEEAYYCANEFDEILNTKEKVVFDAKDKDWKAFKEKGYI